MLESLVHALRPISAEGASDAHRDSGRVEAISCAIGRRSWAAPSARVVWGVIAVFAVAYALLARFGLEAHPYSGDEYSYLLQGRIFAQGRLSAPTPQHPELFAVDHVLLEPAVRSKYPPIWPLCLALGVLLGAPWIIAPLLGAATLGLVHALVRRLHGPGPALATTLVLGVSPFFAINAASYQSHTLCLFSAAAYVACLVRGWERRSTAWAILAGAALGSAFLNRQVDAAFFGLGLFFVLRRAPRYVATCVAAAAAVSALFFVYNAAQFGSVTTTGYALYDPIARAIYGESVLAPLAPDHLMKPIVQWHHVQWFGDLSAWMAPGAIVLAAVGLVRGPRVVTSDADGGDAGGGQREARAACWTILRVAAVAQLVAVALYNRNMGDSFGPRYMFSLLLPMALGVAEAYGAAWRWLAARARAGERTQVERWLAAALVLVVAGGALRVAFLIDAQHDDVARRMRLYALVAERGLAGAVVIVKERFPTRWTRNGTSFDGPVLFVAPTDPDEAIAAWFPSRSIYVASRPDEETDWTLTRLR